MPAIFKLFHNIARRCGSQVHHSVDHIQAVVRPGETASDAIKPLTSDIVADHQATAEITSASMIERQIRRELGW